MELRSDVTDAWEPYEPCAPTTGGSVRIGDEAGVIEELRVALCLERRNEICSDYVDAFVGKLILSFSFLKL